MIKSMFRDKTDILLVLFAMVVMTLLGISAAHTGAQEGGNTQELEVVRHMVLDPHNARENPIHVSGDSTIHVTFRRFYYGMVDIESVTYEPWEYPREDAPSWDVSNVTLVENGDTDFKFDVNVDPVYSNIIAQFSVRFKDLEETRVHRQGKHFRCVLLLTTKPPWTQ